MRTFEEYIVEARQNYIFGGTDNRNTAAIKTFNELERGDKVYWFGEFDGNNSLLSFAFEKIIKDGNVAWIDLSGDVEWNCKASDLDLSTIVDTQYGYCLSTDLDELYDVIDKQLKIKNARNIKIEEQ